MKQEIYICDMCNKKIDPHTPDSPGAYRLSIVSEDTVSYRTKIDICLPCVKKVEKIIFSEFHNHTHEPISN